MKIDFIAAEGSVEFDFTELAQIASDIGVSLLENKFRCVGLKGELGAGKTTLVGALLKSWGHDPSLPVPSPTFTCVQEYELSVGVIAHCDFYRVDNPAFEIQSLLDHR